MRIFFIVPYVPSLIRTRPYNIIRSLTAKGHEVTVATPWFIESEREEAEVLRSECHRVIAVELRRMRRVWNRFRALAALRPMQATLCWNPEFARRLRNELLTDSGQVAFDVAHVEHLRAACYGTYLRSLSSRLPSHLPVVWDAVDCLHLLLEQTLDNNKSVSVRFGNRYDAWRMRSEEARLLGHFRRILVTSRVDRDALATLRGAATSPGLEVVSNGVDLDYFKPARNARREPATIVVTGKMSYHANADMVSHLVKDILPLIRARRPDVKVSIAGKSPPRRIVEFGGLPGVSVTGSVPDLRPCIERATVAVAPLRYGVGVQNKVLEAMACGAPVVGSPQAVSALAAEPGKEVLVGATAEEFARHVLELIESPQRRRRLAEAGRAYVERLHSWPRLASRLERIYEEARASGK